MSALSNDVDRSPLTVTGQLGSARREPFFVTDDFGLALEHFYVPGMFEFMDCQSLLLHPTYLLTYLPTNLTTLPSPLVV